jgi:hypothetical protein
VAARERFPSRLIAEPDGDLWLVCLEAMPSALSLTRQSNLDVPRVDDRVSTGRIDGGRTDPDPLLETCGRLADAVYDWWDGRPPPLVYRSRTMPEVGRNLAFTESASPQMILARPLRETSGLHAHLVLRAAFTVPDAWLR